MGTFDLFKNGKFIESVHTFPSAINSVERLIKKDTSLKLKVKTKGYNLWCTEDDKTVRVLERKRG